MLRRSSGVVARLTMHFLSHIHRLHRCPPPLSRSAIYPVASSTFRSLSSNRIMSSKYSRSTSRPTSAHLLTAAHVSRHIRKVSFFSAPHRVQCSACNALRSVNGVRCAPAVPPAPPLIADLVLKSALAAPSCHRRPHDESALGSPCDSTVLDRLHRSNYGHCQIGKSKTPSSCAA